MVNAKIVNNFIKNPKRGGIPAKDKKFMKIIKERIDLLLIKYSFLIDSKFIKFKGIIIEIEINLYSIK